MSIEKDRTSEREVLSINGLGSSGGGFLSLSGGVPSGSPSRDDPPANSAGSIKTDNSFGLCCPASASGLGAAAMGTIQLTAKAKAKLAAITIANFFLTIYHLLL